MIMVLIVTVVVHNLEEITTKHVLNVLLSSDFRFILDLFVYLIIYLFISQVTRQVIFSEPVNSNN